MIESADAGSNCLGLEFSLYTDTGFVSNQKTGNLLDIVLVIKWILATMTAVWLGSAATWPSFWPSATGAAGHAMDSGDHHSCLGGCLGSLAPK